MAMSDPYDFLYPNVAKLRRVLPKMVRISNNSKITQSVCETLINKLSREEFLEFEKWLSIVIEHKS